MAEEFRYIGNYVPVHDVNEKVTGKLKYVSDMKLEGMLYGKLLLSDVAHAIIKSIDIDEAEKLPGVVKIYTHKNTPKNYYNSHRWYEALETIKDELMFDSEVRFVGDRVALVVAKDNLAAERAVKLIKVEYERLPVVVDPREALNKNSFKIHEENNNHVMDKKIEYGDSRRAFEKADLIIEDTIITPKIHHAAMETHLAIAKIDEFNNIIIYSPCQEVFQSQLVVSDALNIPKRKIRVIKSPMGGSFGGKTHPIVEPICAYVALDLKKPIKIQMDRNQTIVGSRTRHNVIGNVKTAVTKDGDILGREIEVIVDTGAYFTNGDALCMSMGKKLSRLYRIENQKYTAHVVYTNTPIGGACRGYGAPQIHAITEINIDNTARKLNMDPTEFRLKNLVHPYDKDLAKGVDLGNARVVDCVSRGVEKFNWKKRWSNTHFDGRYATGVGMACVTHGNGYYGAYPDFTTATIQMDTDGSVLLKETVHDLGCGTVTVMRQIVAETLDMDIEKVTALEGDTFVTPYDSAGTQASRVTYVNGGAAKKVSELLKERIKSYAAKILECSEEDIVIKNERVWNRNDEDKILSYGEIVVLAEKKFSDDMSVTYTYHSPANPGVYAAVFAEITVDTLTGMTKVNEILAVHDIGRAINKTFVEGQIQGAAQMGIGYALTEEIEIDNNGRIKSNSFSKYHLINAPDMPKVNMDLIEYPDEYGPYGAKSVGEIATNGIAPAIINAINNALKLNITEFPATPERIISALKNRK
ncbi:molybdopterin cofactor-binding domain-containing protein [Clostridium sp. HMP27]|uniref:xanthine dehydrogenase family protein molybdopterin-binding subunit n=1 Tax=Clostridium sp. HMP27 TaxID=1487921 RepID=UPI00052BE913|nr:molybdopterin cofactor-binding domain-containing protein [Clostridium sp. HMP27]KGK82724.1 hypothetical protein DP68_17415 [Clostridium sp. HMP27]